MNIILIVILCFLQINTSYLEGNLFSSKIKLLFEKFKEQYNKEYNPDQLNYRVMIFTRNILKYSKHLLFEDKPIFSPFFDLTEEEFKIKYLTLKIDQNEKYDISYPKFSSKAPDSFDYRDKGAVGPVKNQENCGSCWAFSTVGNIEGLYALGGNNFLSFSEKQLVDCDNIDQGCDGGLMIPAINYIKRAGGLESEKDYPYFPVKEICRFDKDKVKVKVKGFTAYSLFNSLDEEELKQILYEVGPLSIAINAELFQTYIGGIIKASASRCNPSALNHSVILVGYGEEAGTKYWTIKNSWGTLFGEKGYVRIERGKGTCGVNKYVISAVLDTDK